MKIAISGKGGVGKTTVAATLAKLFADSHKKVYAVDADPDACLAAAVGIPDEQIRNLKPLVDLKELVDKILRAYGYKDQLDEIELIKQYELAVGNMFVKHTENVYFQNKKLFVKLNSAALKQEMSYAKEALKEKLNSTMGRHIINEIVII